MSCGTNIQALHEPYDTDAMTYEKALSFSFLADDFQEILMLVSGINCLTHLLTVL
jgi:hypothetical protein